MRKSLERMRKLLERDMPSLLAQEARGLAVEYGRATGPGFSLSEKPLASYRKKIDGEIRAWVATPGSPSKVYEWLQRHRPEYAAAYWRAVKQEAKSGQARILRQAGVSAQLDVAAMAKVRGKKRGAEELVGYASEAQVARYSKQQQARAGMAQAGWYAAAKGFGGRVRRTIRTADGKRRSEQIFPASVRKLERVFPNLGRGWMEGQGMKSAANIESLVRHARDAIPDRMYNFVAIQAERNLGRALRQALQAAAKKRRARSR